MPKPKLLFVDDNIFPFLPLVRKLNEAFDLKTVGSLREAVDFVSSKSKGGDFVEGYIIDLELPIDDVPRELKQHVERLGIAPVNAGQALAAWLRERQRTVRYVYMTANTDFLDPKLEPDKKERLLVKGSDNCTRDKIIDTVTKALFGEA